LVVIGGSQEENKRDLKNDEEECQRIIQRCSKLVPSVKNAKVSKENPINFCKYSKIKINVK